VIKAYTDGACRISNPGLCSSAFVVYKDNQIFYREGRVLEGMQTNNTAEYTALLDLLMWAEKENVRNLIIHCDSALVVNQTNQQWECNKPDLKKLSAQAYGMLIRGAHVLKHIKGHDGNEGNEAADALCNVLLDEYQGVVNEK
jgi:ribonuclease HI